MGIFKKNKKITKSHFNQDFAEVFANSISLILFKSLVSVDGGSLGVATEWLPSCLECDETYFQKECETCGRNVTNYIDFRAGRGDGVYPVFSLISGETSIGCLILFDSENSLYSIGSLYTGTINDMREYTEENEIQQGLDEVGELLPHFLDSYEEDLPIYELGSISVEKTFDFSDKEFNNRYGYLVIGESGEGINSTSAMGTINIVEPGEYKVLISGMRDNTNNDIFIPRFAMIIKSDKAESMGLSEDIVPKLNFKEEKSKWNNATVAAYIGNPQNNAAFYSNSLYYLSNFSHYESQNLPKEELRFAALGAASWILMLHSVVPNNELVQQINQILHQFDADVKLIHELRGQLSRRLI